MDSKRRVLITGSSRGIGAAIAREIVAEYSVILHGKSRSRALEDLGEELGAEEVVYFDVGDAKRAREVLSPLVEGKPLYGVVLNAGICCDNTFAGLSLEEWNRVINVNLNSFYNVLNPLIMPIARQKLGRIVVLSSVAGIVGNRGQSNYSASKAGLIGASKSLAIELASRNITVNVVAPGLINTDMISKNTPLDKILELIPARRMGEPREVASLVKFLLSSEASYITKQVIGVNGGLV